MLQDIRANSQGTIAKIIIGLIVISFSIFGIESLLFSGGASGVAEVNGEEISPFALQQELSVQQRQLLALLGDDADPALLDEAQLSQQALDVLISREILRQAAADLDLRTSDRVIGELITGMQQFQIDGTFSRDMFRSSLASAGFTPALFRERLAEDLQIGQLRAGIAGSDFSTPAELDLTAAIALEGRDVRYITLPLADFLADVEVSDDAIENFYNSNQDAFLTDEQVVVEYLELNLDDFRQPVDEARLREEFELVRDDYELATEARVSHILLEGSNRALQSVRSQAAWPAAWPLQTRPRSFRTISAPRPTVAIWAIRPARPFQRKWKRRLPLSR
jgi:peptidyl-prolyl cis-trans isomerase D